MHTDKPVMGKSCFHVAQTLFPSTMCSAFVEIISLLDDQAVSLDGTAVYEVAYDVRGSIRYCFCHYDAYDPVCVGGVVLPGGGQQPVFEVLHGEADQGLPGVHLPGPQDPAQVHPKVATAGGVLNVQLHHRIHHVLCPPPQGECESMFC